MNFREAYQDDLDEAFFDTEEFASEHVIDGKPRTVILLNRDGQDAGRRAINPKEYAVGSYIVTMYIRESDAWRKFTANATMNLDGETVWISRVQHTMGVIRLQLERKKK